MSLPPVQGPSDPPSPEAPASDAPAVEDSASAAVVEAAGGGDMIRSSLVYSGMTLVSRVFGFLRDIVVTAAMGASSGVSADAWNTALAFPNLFRRIFAEGAFAAAFVPAYSKSLAKDGEEVADVLAADAMAVLAAATIILALVAELTMPWLMHLIAPGFAADPAKFKLAVVLTQITMPYLPCMAIYAHLSGVLNARGKFAVAAFAPALLNIFTLLTVLPQKTPQAAAYAAAVGALLAGVAQAGLLWWGVRKSGARVDIRRPRLTPEIKALIALAVPGAVAASASQINIFISGVLASQVNGARSWLSVAERLYQLPLGLIGVAVGVALLPSLSRAVQLNDRAAQQATMDQAVAFSLAFTLPAATALVSIPYFLIDALYTRGAFHAVDAHATARILFHYGWGTPAFVLARIFTPVFFARQDTKGPMRFALTSVAVNIAMGLLLFHLVGVEGIAAATSLASWVNVALMVVTLYRRGQYAPGPRAVTQIAKILAASVAMGACLALFSAARPALQPLLLGSKELLLVAVVPIGVLLYFGLLFGLKAVRPNDIRTALRRRPAAATSSTDLN